MLQGYITVIGAVNVDINGASFRPLIEGDSNPGRVTMSLGGVGRNIADNLCRLGAPVRLITVLGEDVHLGNVERSCEELGIDLTYSQVIPRAGTSTYLCINDADGVMRLAISDMDICHYITPDFLKTRLDMINRSALVVVDANLEEEAIAYLAEHCTVPMFADPVSIPKAARMKDHLRNIYCIKPNRPEAEVLSGQTIRSREDLPLAAQAIREKGVKAVFISLGGEGIYYDDGVDRGIFPCYPGTIISTTGCGDAFLAAAAYGYYMGRDLKEMARMGLAAASLCAEAQGAILEKMSLQLIESKMKETGGKAV